MRSLFTGLFYFCCFCFAQKHTIKFYLKDEAAQPVENAVCKFIKDSKTIESISYTDSLGFSSTEIQRVIICCPFPCLDIYYMKLRLK